ncbi:MAG TPA: hypothetical protein VF181_09875 [Balneolaceae bacterium]
MTLRDLVKAAVTLLIITISVSCAMYPYTIEEWDYNDDLYLDEDEFQSALDDVGYYETWNYDGEDYLTEDEWNEGINDFFGAYHSDDFGTFADWDVDGDGLLSDDEFDEGVFETVDLNDDGQIEADEFDEWYDEV